MLISYASAHFNSTLFFFIKMPHLKENKVKIEKYIGFTHNMTVGHFPGIVIIKKNLIKLKKPKT